MALLPSEQHRAFWIQMVPHCMCVLLAQMIHSYLTAMKSFISQLYNNSFHMTSGSAINKIKSKRKDLIKENDIKSSIKWGGGIPISSSSFFFFLRIKLYRVLSNFPQYAMKRYLQAVSMCRIHLRRTQSGQD